MTEDEMPVATVPPATGGRRNPRYERVDAVLREQPGVWRKVVAVKSRNDAQKWRQAGVRKGWVIKQRRTDDGWDLYGCVPEVTR